MSSQGLKDLREGVLGFTLALALVGALAVIFLGAFGYFDQGIKYQYPAAAAAQEKRQR